MKKVLIFIAVFFLTILQTNGRDYYVREVDLELAPLREVLGNFIIPFAKANGFSYVNNHIEVLIDNNEIIVQLVRGIPTFHCYWSDNTTAVSPVFKTGICEIEGTPVRIRAAEECPFIKILPSVRHYSADCSDNDRLLSLALYENVDGWCFRYNGRLILESAVTFTKGPEYERDMIPPGFKIER